MPSLEESRRFVQQELASRDVHDDILAGLQDEIDKHNAIKNDIRQTIHDNRTADRSSKLRFKSDHDARIRKEKRRRHRSHYHASHGIESTDEPAAHPFPRESLDPDHPTLNSDTAFREALFDALADDEGAHYWEGVYNQPIHIYARPTVQTTSGKLEHMSDEEYTTYVKTKMWEKKNPHVVHERERAARKRKEAEEAQTREREEFVRRKQQAEWGREESTRRKQQPAWERTQKSSGFNRRGRSEGEEDEDGGERVFAGHGNLNQDDGSREETVLSREFAAAWEKYLKAWEKLIQKLGKEAASQITEESQVPASRRIPWPVLRSKPVTRPHIEDFFHHSPGKSSAERMQLLKNERVRWHPDKVQQRFVGRVDDGTMKIVTGVFQIIDSLLDEIRKK